MSLLGLVNYQFQVSSSTCQFEYRVSQVNLSIASVLTSYDYSSLLILDKSISSQRTYHRPSSHLMPSISYWSDCAQKPSICVLVSSNTLSSCASQFMCSSASCVNRLCVPASLECQSISVVSIVRQLVSSELRSLVTPLQTTHVSIR